eukprot:TRINITY_DN87444_c0_g1_i1.p1 TRINITY_DN87444_c0_g1~~TRINITY_DN87444_c0_g1_i1.p1  ORF type:complete len:213 (-),score=49.21 TRINITY_DN87444_c0_g1_i1:79-717(-)
MHSIGIKAGPFYERYDPLREAQELLEEQRPLAPPKPEDVHRDAGAPPKTGFPPQVQASQQEVAMSPGRNYHASSPLSAGAQRRQAHGQPAKEVITTISPRKQNPAEATPRPVVSRATRAAADLKLMKYKPSNGFRGPTVLSPREPLGDFKKRSIWKSEQLQTEGRWPAEALYAGYAPDFIRERYDRLGTITQQHGDGRTLPHERNGEHWFIN